MKGKEISHKKKKKRPNCVFRRVSPFDDDLTGIKLPDFMEINSSAILINN